MNQKSGMAIEVKLVRWRRKALGSPAKHTTLISHYAGHISRKARKVYHKINELIDRESGITR